MAALQPGAGQSHRAQNPYLCLKGLCNCPWGGRRRFCRQERAVYESQDHGCNDDLGDEDSGSLMKRSMKGARQHSQGREGGLPPPNCSTQAAVDPFLTLRFLLSDELGFERIGGGRPPS